MRDVLASLDAWAAEGHGIARAVVVRTYGSAPRREGATLLLCDDGRIAGSVSGGCVEGATVGYLEEARASGLQRVVRFGVTDEQAWEVGLACGGTIDVLVQPAIPEAALQATRVVAQADARTRLGRAVVTPLPTGSPSLETGPAGPGPAGPMVEPMVVHEDGRVESSRADRPDPRATEAGHSGIGRESTPGGSAATVGHAASTPELIAAAQEALAQGRSTVLVLGGRQLFIEAFPLRPRLVIVGGVPVAQSLARLARELGYEVVVIDARPSFATSERFPEVDQLSVGWPDEVAMEIGLGPADAVAVLSHDPKFDEPAILDALQRGCRYVGAIGSRKTQAARRARLREAGLSEAQLQRLRGPIGLDLGGRSPAETALAIMAEVVAARYDASARPMSAGGA